MTSEVPKVFRGPMIRALLSGEKTQFREIADDPYHPPYRPGQRIWVQEHFLFRPELHHDDPSRLTYEADVGRSEKRFNTPDNFKRWMCRIELQVRTLGIQPLKNISLTEVKKEGIPTLKLFIRYWDHQHQHDKRTYATNPLVWIVTFDRMKPVKNVTIKPRRDVY